MCVNNLFVIYSNDNNFKLMQMDESNKTKKND